MNLFKDLAPAIKKETKRVGIDLHFFRCRRHVDRFCDSPRIHAGKSPL